MIDTLQQIYSGWQTRTRAAIKSGLEEEKAKNIACDKDSVKLFEMLPEIIQKLSEKQEKLCTK